jgi:hypothetical protein
VEALREARSILAEDQDDPAAHELAAALSCCKNDVTESFLHYKMALDLGELTRPTPVWPRSCRLDGLASLPRHSARILAGASPLERLALRTASSPSALRGLVGGRSAVYTSTGTGES